jgi:hypothetical protein
MDQLAWRKVDFEDYLLTKSCFFPKNRNFDYCC